MRLNLTDPIRCVLKETDPDFVKADGISFSTEFEPYSNPPVDRFSLKQSMTPARNQNPLGTCASFCTVSCLEYFYQIDLSEAEIIEVAERRHNNCLDDGISLVYPMRTAQNWGAVVEADFPYARDMVCHDPEPDMRQKKHYSFSKIAILYQNRRSEIESRIATACKSQGSRSSMSAQPTIMASMIKSVLYNARYPIAVSIPVFFRRDNKFDAGWEWEAGGVVKMPTPLQLEQWLATNRGPFGESGWHCICVTGFDDSVGRFEFKNSWGSWGQNGYGSIPYEYIGQYSDLAMYGWV